MPRITKQNRTGSTKRKKTSSVLDRIAPVGQITTGLKFLVYGRSKTGKTRLASTFPKPALLIGTEDGTKSVASVKGLHFVKLQKSDDLEEITGLLAKGEYRTGILDTAGGLLDLMLKEVAGLDELPVQRHWGMATREDWMAAGAQFKERMRTILDLVDSSELNFVTIAHERNFNEDSDSDVLAPSVGAALSPSVASWLNGACDYLCQTYLKEKVVVKEIKVGKKVKKVTRPTGEIEFCLRTGPHEVFMTGFRLPPGQNLPEFISDPTYDKILKIIQGS